jgi:hypothetical protein
MSGPSTPPFARGATEKASGVVPLVGKLDSAVGSLSSHVWSDAGTRLNVAALFCGGDIAAGFGKHRFRKCIAAPVDAQSGVVTISTVARRLVSAPLTVPNLPGEPVLNASPREPCRLHWVPPLMASFFWA